MLFSADGAISPHLVIFCNQRLVDRGQFNHALAEGDELMLFPAISGGAPGDAHRLHRNGGYRRRESDIGQSGIAELMLCPKCGEGHMIAVMILEPEPGSFT